MKKAFLIVAMLATMSATNAQERKSYTREGNVLTAVITNNGRDVRANASQTKLEWRHTDGKTYPIWVVNSTGSTFIIVVSKKGNEYRKYLGREVSADICREIGKEYKPTNK